MTVIVLTRFAKPRPSSILHAGQPLSAQPALLALVLTLTGIRLAAQPAAPPDTAPPSSITSVAQARALKPEEADRGYPVHLTGTITFNDPAWSMLFLHDGTMGIYIHQQVATRQDLIAGSRIELQGFTASGIVSHVVVEPQFKLLGTNALPAPKPISLPQLLASSEDGQWVELQAGVRRVSVEGGGHLMLEAGDARHRFRMVVPGYRTRPLPRQLVDAKVRVKGVPLVRKTDTPNRLEVSLLVNRFEDIELIEPAPASIQNLSTPSTSALVRAAEQTGGLHRMRALGVVVHAKPGLFYLHDTKGSIRVRIGTNAPPPRVGDTLDVAGFVDLTGPHPELEEPLLRPADQTQTIEPRLAVPKDLLSDDTDGLLVRLEAELTSFDGNDGLHLLTCQQGNLSFTAELDLRPNTEAIPRPPLGSILRLTGVVVVSRAQGQTPRRFHLLLRSPADLVAVRKPSTFSLAKALPIVGIFAALGVVAFAWIVALRRRMREQTQQLNLQVAQEAALEERYRHLFENASDVVYTHDLAGKLTSVNAAAERILGYTHEELLGLQTAQFATPEDADRIRAIIAEKLEHGGSTRYEAEFLAKDGRRLTLEISSWPVYQGAKIAAIHGIARDVTERKRSERLTSVFAALGEKLSAASSPREAAQIVLDGAQELIGWDAAHLDFYDRPDGPNQPILYLDTIGARRVEIPPGAPSPPGLIARRVLTQGAEMILRKPDDPPAQGLVAFGDRNRPSASLLFVPIRNGQVVIGILSVQSYRFKAYTRKDLLSLQALADHAGGAFERMKFQQALRESEAKLRNIVEAEPGCVILLRQDGSVQDINPAGRAMLELDDDPQGKHVTLTSHVLPEYHLAFRSQVRQTFEGRSSTTEIEIVGRSGTRRWIQIQCVPFKDALGQISACLGLLNDITAHKRILARSEVLSRLGLELSTARTPKDAGSVILDAAQKLLGWDAASVDLCFPESPHAVSVLYMDTIADHRVEVQPTRNPLAPGRFLESVLKNGGRLILREPPINLTDNLTPFGNKDRLSASLLFVPIRKGTERIGVLSIQSYTHHAYADPDLEVLQTLADHAAGALDRIHAESAFQHSEERFAKAFRSSPVAVSITSLAEGRILDINDSFLALLGYQREEALGRSAADLGFWADPADRTRLVQALTEQRTVRNMPFSFRKRGGEVRQGLASAETLTLKAEDCVLLIVLDMTEHISLESQLRHAQKMEAIGQLAAGLAHDLNNIMTVIQGHARLRLDEDCPSSARFALNEIASAADRAANLTRQLLAFSRKQVMHLRTVDLNHVIADISKMLKRLLSENIAVHFAYHPTPLPTRADAALLEQVIMNLTVNARDAMPQGGHLTISTELIEIDDTTAAGRPESHAGRFVLMTVSDTGTGMDPSVLNRIFEPFFTTKDVGKGTGLGLAMVYGIVKQHHGWVEASSTPNQGSTFRVFLPFSTALIDAPKEPTRTIPARGSETILLVEDEPALRGMVRGALEAQGYHVIDAGSGPEALLAWQAMGGGIDLLFTDIVMPNGMSGRELAETLLARKPDLPVLYTTGYSLEIAGKNLELHEGVNFLPKPYPPNRLIQVIRDCLDQTRTPAARN